MSDRTKILDEITRAIISMKPEIAGQDIQVDTMLYQFDVDGNSQPRKSLELDSLDAMDLVTLLEDHFGVELPEDVDLAKILTVGDIIDAIASAQDAG